MQISIDRELYTLSDPGECVPITHPTYNTLKLYHGLADWDRLVYFVYDLLDAFWKTSSIGIAMDTWTEQRLGGYVQQVLRKVSAATSSPSLWVGLCPDETDEKIPDSVGLAITAQEQYVANPQFMTLPWKQRPGWFVHVHPESWNRFQYIYYRNIRIEAHYEIIWDYENLLHLVMMVKNAGKGFRQVLEKNIPHIDRWTILDTGSTDGTIQIIKDVLDSRVRGKLYQEPFVDFSTTRNRALELAGTVCKYVVMLDDTYWLTGNLREFLTEIRSDQFADSYSLYIQSSDVQYASNRLLKSNRQLRYKFKIHEVIDDTNNIVVIVPPDRALVHDEQSEYMQERTAARKTLDLKLLQDSIHEDFQNPRHWYYMAQTYVGMKEYESAYKYFLARVFHPQTGFLQEKIDACFEAARTAQFQLKRPWEEVKPLYERAYAMDPSRPDSVYFLGIKAMMDQNHTEAYTWFKKAFEIGYPIHAQYSLKPTLSFHFTPRFLVNSLCWENRDYALGERAAQLYLEKNPYDPTMDSWHNIYRLLNRLPKRSKPVQFAPVEKPYLIFVADGNWAPWSGRDLREKGLGGSETYIVEMAEHIQQTGKYQVLVFCQCNAEGEFHGVQYQDLAHYYSFITDQVVHTCIISRFSEYLPVTYKSQVENVYLVVHDLSPTGVVLVRDPKLKKIFVLTEWHQTYLEKIYPSMRDLMVPLYYGIHTKSLEAPSKPVTFLDARNPTFIYSSFPNRGLLVLLQMWPDIRTIFPYATLHIYANLEHPWCLKHFPEDMRQIQILVDQPGITCHGWVKSTVLNDAWREADIWFYPCIFQETFCHTALQAAASRTLAITSDLAALQNTVGNRGWMVPGDPRHAEWQRAALDILRQLTPQTIQEHLDANEAWARAHSWGAQSEKLLQWIDEFPLEYRGLYNWTSDVPPNSRSIVQSFLISAENKNNPLNILEIGTYTGTSLVHLLQRFPQSRGTVIDPWKNYIEYPDMQHLRIRESFKRNLTRTGLTSRVTIHRGTSQKQLIECLMKQCTFDLIVIDGSHNALDTFADLILAWALLVPGGRMMIDNYNLDASTVEYEYSCPKALVVPKVAVDRFLELYATECVVLHCEYRVFLEKKKK